MIKPLDTGKEVRRLNIGCGNEILKGFVNIDVGDCPADMIVDIQGVTPFPDNCFDVIVSKHCLEHIRKDLFFAVFREIHRILKPNGILEFCVPKGGSDNFFTDPTHSMPFTDRTMDFIIDGKQLRENGVIYGADYSFTEVSKPQVDNVETLYFKLSKKSFS